MAARGALRMPRQALNRFNALGGRTICNGQKGYGEGMIARLGATVRFGEGSSSTVSVREGDVGGIAFASGVCFKDLGDPPPLHERETQRPHSREQFQQTK